MCEHLHFTAQVNVHRLEDTGRFTTDVSISCADCGTPFRFKGLGYGISLTEPRLSPDGQELRAPIEPAPIATLLGRPVLRAVDG